jgi:hypothetical protein
VRSTAPNMVAAHRGTSTKPAVRRERDRGGCPKIKNQWDRCGVYYVKPDCRARTVAGATPLRLRVTLDDAASSAAMASHQTGAALTVREK